MPDPYQGQPEAPPSGDTEGGVKGALTRKLGPLAAWQWGVAVGGGLLIYFYLRGGGPGSGGSSGTTGANAMVPFTSNGSDGISNVVSTVVKKTQEIRYYSAKMVKKVPIRDRTGKIVGYFAAGRTILLGKAVMINGKRMYPILNMPGKYLWDQGAAGFAKTTLILTPVYADSTATTTTTTTPTSAQLSMPSFTAESEQLSNVGLFHAPVLGGNSTTPGAYN